MDFKLYHYRSCGRLDPRGFEMYASRVNAQFILCVFLAGALVGRAESADYFVYVSNERSGDISVIDGATDSVVATF